MPTLSAITRGLIDAFSRIPPTERRAAERRLRDQLGDFPEIDQAKEELAIREAITARSADPADPHRRQWRDAAKRRGESL